MTSVLRMGNKDRSSFMFFRRQNIAVETQSSDSLAHRLPDISPLDTRSFSGLFDEFMNPSESSVAQEQHSHQTEAAPSPIIAGTLKSISYTTLPLKLQLNNEVDHLKVNVARNDSTASSCYSQPSQMGSDLSPLVTRQSSSSSYTPEPSPAISRRTTYSKLQPLVIRKRSAQILETHLTRSPVSAPASPLRSNSALIRVVSVPPDLDKPLPPGPISNANKASSSVPDLLLRQPPAELPAEMDTSALTTGSISTAQPSRRLRRVTIRRDSEGSKMDMPSWSSRSTRALQSGRDNGGRHIRNGSVSETAAPAFKGPGSDQSRRHTAEMHDTPSTEPISPPQSNISRKHQQRPITATTAENVIYRIMCSVHSSEDLQATAMVSKGFYRTFQRNESKLVSHLIFKSSRAAWELRRSTLALTRSDDFLLKDYRRDCRTIEALKAFIVAHCSATCKRDTLVGLLGQDDVRMAQIDTALWRIWTFCTLFGTAVHQSGPAKTEINWLNGSRATGNKQLGAGFAVGNGKGLTIRELEDMNEMWQCLQVLVSGFHGKEEEAKRCGVFDNWHLRESTTDTQHLAEWTCYLLALGPQTILTLSGCSLDQARMLGLTTWPLPPAGQSRSTFLTSAIAQVYRERVLEDATRRAAQMSTRRTNGPVRAPSHRPTKSLEEKHLSSVASTRADRLQAQSLRIDTSRPRRRPVSTIFPVPTPTTRPDVRSNSDSLNAKMDIRPDCDPSWTSNPPSALLPTSPTSDPTVYYSMNMTSTASAKMGATLFPMDYASPGPRVPFPAPEKSTASVSQVVDPVDKAMNLLVREFGFPETRARKALAMCDTGSGIDLQKAIDLLSVDGKEKQKQIAPVELPTPGILASLDRPRSLQPRKAFCDGHCRRSSTSGHSRNHSTGTTITSTDASVSPISIANEAEWLDTISPLVPTSASTSRQNTLTRVSSRAKAWKVLGRDSSPKRRNSVLRIDEYQAKVERRKSLRAVSGGESSPKVKESSNKNLLGSLGLGSIGGSKSAEDQLDRAREDERRKKDKNKASCMPI